MFNVPADCQIKGLAEIYKDAGFQPDGGTFVEIGAFDGETFSNTSFLADGGWTGYYVEPVKEYADKCKERHKDNDVYVFETAVSDYVGKAEISVAGDISTIDPDMAALFNEIPFKHFHGRHGLDIREVDVTTLSRLIWKIDPLMNLDLLVIDTEGTELEVLKGNDFELFSPKLLIVEMHEKSQEWDFPLVREKNKQIQDLLYENSYNRVYADDINTVWRRV